MYSDKADVAGFELIYGLVVILSYFAVALAGQRHEDFYARTAHGSPDDIADVVGVHSPAEHLDHILSSTISVGKAGSVYFIEQRGTADQVDTALELLVPGVHII